jgi:signal transduction histidine kinase
LSTQPILRWFASPEFSRPELQSRARATWFVSWALFAVVTVLLGIAVMVEPHTLSRRAVTVTAVGSVVIIIHFVSRSGRPVLASWMFVLGLTAVVTQRAWITGGIHAPVAVFFALFVIIAGVLIGTRGAVVTAIACFVGAIILTVGTARGWLITRPGAGSSLGGLVFAILAISLALVLVALMNRWSRRERVGGNAVHMLVHDMRSPIQVLLAHLELLRQNIGGESAEDVDAAIGGAATLNRMTSSILDVARFEAGRMPLHRSATDLSVLAESVVIAMRIIQPTRDISVQSRGDSMCNCDPEIIRRVIENLVSNAIKHTQREGSVHVMISGSPESARVAVQDEGLGVAPENRKRIFDPYSAEGVKTESGYQTFGLGLAFCKLAVEAHGGTIRIEDATPRGSVFIFELPR